MKDSYLCIVNEKDEICAPPRRQKLHSAQAIVIRAESERDSNSETKKIINKHLLTIKIELKLWH